MAGRRTNLSLLAASLLALITGVGAFIVGTPAGRWVIVSHGVAALAIVALTPWKSVVAKRGMSRRRRGRGLSLGLTFVTVGTIATGVILVVGGTDRVGPFTTMQLHVSLGLLMISLTLLHTLQRPVQPRSSDLSRRSFLRAGGLLAAAGGLWLSIEAVLDAIGARGGDRRFTGSHFVASPEDVPVTQWINDRVQHLDPASHRVMVGAEQVTVEEVAQGGDVVQATLDCTGGWYTTQEWSGTLLARLLGDMSGESVVVRSATGYWRRFPMDEASGLLLATHMAGRPLTDGHGGPLRLVAPGRRGYWWVKWVDTIEADDQPAWWQPPMPTA